MKRQLEHVERHHGADTTPARSMLHGDLTVELDDVLEEVHITSEYPSDVIVLPRTFAEPWVRTSIVPSLSPTPSIYTALLRSTPLGRVSAITPRHIWRDKPSPSFRERRPTWTPSTPHWPDSTRAIALWYVHYYKNAEYEIIQIVEVFKR